MQTKLADFSKFPIFLKVMTDQLEYMKETIEWLGTVETVISQLQEKYDIVLGKHGSRRSNWSSITSVCEYRTLVAIPYIDSLLENIRNRFSDRSLKIVHVTAMFILIQLRSPQKNLCPHMGMSKSSYWLDFMEKKQQWNMTGKPTHPNHLLMPVNSSQSGGSIDVPWQSRKKSLMDRKNSPILSPTMQDILEEMRYP